MSQTPPPAGDPGGQTPPATPPNVPPATPPAVPPATPPATVDSLPDWAQKLIADTRSEAASYRTKHKETEDKLKTYETAQLTEAEKLQKRAQEAETRAQDLETKQKETLTRLEIERQARKLNIVDEDAAFRLLDHAKIEFKDGAPTNVEALLAALVTAKPYLVQSAGSGAPGNPATSHAGLTPEKLRTMSREQIMAIPDAELNAILAGR